MTEQDMYGFAATIFRYITDSASEADIKLVEEWKNDSERNSLLLDRLSQRPFLREIIEDLRTYDSRQAFVKFKNRRHRSIFRRRVGGIAAAILVGAAIISAFMLMPHDMAPETVAENVTVTLSDNKDIPLSEQDGVFRDQGHVFRSEDDQIDYSKNSPQSPAAKKTVFHTLTVPRGKEFSIVLSDGTSVKLNSDSKLKYPIIFDREKREVSIVGEAYFRVAKDVSRPFIVKTPDYYIRVTGTEFNVRSYDKSTATTLVEGSVEITVNDIVYKMRPGQQATITPEGVSIADVRLYAVTAWERGELMFSRVTLGYIMGELARCYDIKEFVFDNNELRDMLFSATLKRSNSLSQILELLEATNRVKFEFTENSLRIMSNDN